MASFGEGGACSGRLKSVVRGRVIIQASNQTFSFGSKPTTFSWGHHRLILDRHSYLLITRVTIKNIIVIILQILTFFLSFPLTHCFPLFPLETSFCLSSSGRGNRILILTLLILLFFFFFFFLLPFFLILFIVRLYILNLVNGVF